MNNKSSLLQWVGVVGFVISLIACFWLYSLNHLKTNGTYGATTASGMLAENYIPYILYNGGYNSAKPVNLTSTLDVSGVSTFTGAAALTSSFTLGSSGTAQVNQVTTTCSMKADNASLGTTTQYAYCTGVTGVTSSDNIVALFATSSTALIDQWVIVGAKASSTAGTVDFRIFKQTGVAASQAMSAVTTLGSTTVLQVSH